MYPYTAQAGLDAWPAGSQPEEEFITASRWYEHWGYNWHYYRDIFLYARAHRLPLVAVNTPREVVAAVRRKGLEGLTPEERAHIPADIDVDHADHMAFFKATFAGAEGPVHGPGMSDTMWRNMLSAQATWDASMGANAVKALARPENRDAIMVVLVGSGHVAYGVGIERQARKWFDGRIASLIPVAVTRVHGPTVKTAQASYANYLWAVPTEIDTLYPSLGLSMAVGQGETARTVLLVQNGTPAAGSGVPAEGRAAVDGRRADPRQGDLQPPDGREAVGRRRDVRGAARDRDGDAEGRVPSAAEPVDGYSTRRDRGAPATPTGLLRDIPRDRGWGCGMLRPFRFPYR